MAGAEAVLPGQCAEQGVPWLPAEQYGTAVESELGLLWRQPWEGSPTARVWLSLGFPFPEPTAAMGGGTSAARCADVWEAAPTLGSWCPVEGR